MCEIAQGMDFPVGMALKGARVGEEVIVEAPDGEFKYRILDIKRAI